MYKPCPSSFPTRRSSDLIGSLVCPRISAKNGKVCPESAKIVWRKRKRHPDMVPIPCPGQVQMFTPHKEYMTMVDSSHSPKNEKSNIKQKKIHREKEKKNK